MLKVGPVWRHGLDAIAQRCHYSLGYLAFPYCCNRFVVSPGGMFWQHLLWRSTNLWSLAFWGLGSLVLRLVCATRSPPAHTTIVKILHENPYWPSVTFLLPERPERLPGMFPPRALRRAWISLMEHGKEDEDVAIYE